jgi:hypothetical protein
MTRRLLIALTLAVSPACTDFDTPSELTREQIVAVRSTPASVAPGTRGRLEALVAGPDGVVDDGELDWSLSAPHPSASIELDADGAWLAVEAGAEPGPVEVALLVTTPSGSEIDAVKTVAIEEAARQNPGPMGIEAGGQSIGGGELRVAARAEVVLRADVDAGDAAQVSWFATVGEIELYRRNPTDLVAPEEPGSGWLIAVVRDGEGGVDWQILPLVVE